MPGIRMSNLVNLVHQLEMCGFDKFVHYHDHRGYEYEKLTLQQLCGTDELIASIRRRQVVVWLIAASASHWLTPCSISKIELICRIWGI